MLNVRAPVNIGEITVAGAEPFPERRRARLTCICRASKDIVRDGKALVKVPSQPMKGRPLPEAFRR
jgi:3-hydroxybutyryl-CoA dehydratase